MTMHLVGPYMTTTRYNRKKNRKQLSDAQLEKLKVEWRQYNKRMRKMHCHSAQFDEFDDYIAYTQGKYTPKAQKSATDVQKYAHKSAEPYRRETPHIPSHSSGVGTAVRAPDKVYTGDKIKGIGTMHKSNAVPVFSDEEAIAISKMRR